MPSGRCLGQMWWTFDRSRSWVNHLRHYLCSQTPAACSWSTPARLRTYCTRRSTSCWGCHVAAGQTSAYSGRPLSPDWAGRCQTSSCLSSRWNRLYTPPMNGWSRYKSSEVSVGSAKERNILQNISSHQQITVHTVKHYITRRGDLVSGTLLKHDAIC